MMRTSKLAGAAIRWIAPTATIMTIIAGTAACSSPHPTASSSAAAQATSAASSGAATSAIPGDAAASAAPSMTSGSTHTAPKKDIIPGLITFSGKLRLSGAQNLNMSFVAFPGVTSPKSSCAHIAAVGTPIGKGRIPQFRIPSPPEGSNVVIATDISPYHGPGTYQKASLVTVGPSVVVGVNSYNVLGTGATVTVMFQANGSGQLTFARAAAAQLGQPTLSGSIQWTCSVQ